MLYGEEHVICFACWEQKYGMLSHPGLPFLQIIIDPRYRVLITSDKRLNVIHVYVILIYYTQCDERLNVIHVYVILIYYTQCDERLNVIHVYVILIYYTQYVDYTHVYMFVNLKKI